MTGTVAPSVDTDVDPGRRGSVRDLRPAQPEPVDRAGLDALLTELAGQDRLPVGDALALLGAVLDRVDTTDLDRGLLRAEALLDLTEAAVRVGDRMAGLGSRLLGEAVAREASTLAYGTGTSSWLAHRFPLTRKQASAAALAAHRGHSFPATTAAVIAGAVRPGQASVVVDTLRRLPVELPTAEVDRAEQTMLGLARDYPSDDLARLGNRMVEVVDPDGSDQALAIRLHRQETRAWTDRYLELHPTGQGAMLVKGLLPEAEARQLVLQLDAVAADRRRTALEARDPEAPHTSLRARRADALLWLSTVAAAHRDAPTVAGDRPRVVIRLTIDQLDRLTRSGVGPDPLTGCVADGGLPVPARVARRWLCDPDLQLLVTDPTGRHTAHLSTPNRLADPKLRTALAIRDRGCVFPGCDVAPHLCDAHHIQPWWTGGPTRIDNLALLCPHHHRLLEPTRHGDPADQWQIRMGDDRLPEILPPWRVDPRQRPRRQPPPIGTLEPPPVR